MTSGQMMGLAGAVVGSLIGIIGGIVGTYFGVKNTHGPKERAFAIQAVVVGWICILLFVGLLFALPDPYRWIPWVLYAMLLPAGILSMNRRQQRIRQEDASDRRMLQGG